VKLFSASSKMKGRVGMYLAAHGRLCCEIWMSKNQGLIDKWMFKKNKSFNLNTFQKGLAHGGCSQTSVFLSSENLWVPFFCFQFPPTSTLEHAKPRMSLT
jgi:hypothetical protein